MKTNYFPFNCTVQSATDPTGRRVLKFTRVAPDAELVGAPVKRCTPPFRLSAVMTPEAAFSFEPVIQVRSQAKP